MSSLSRINDAVERILRIKFILGANIASFTDSSSQWLIDIAKAEHTRSASPSRFKFYHSNTALCPTVIASISKTMLFQFPPISASNKRLTEKNHLHDTAENGILK
ncbi:Uncharacterized protein Fot_26882 [Forsythia ovata]|uniref:Uncharacterized protein n=1 Tax=Forsythia ovata TaxID=205694 RepID=A0ABD1UD44_9LAMI